MLVKNPRILFLCKNSAIAMTSNPRRIGHIEAKFPIKAPDVVCSTIGITDGAKAADKFSFSCLGAASDFFSGVGADFATGVFWTVVGGAGWGGGGGARGSVAVNDSGTPPDKILSPALKTTDWLSKDNDALPDFFTRNDMLINWVALLIPPGTPAA